jgi:hypothetical protein
VRPNAFPAGARIKKLAVTTMAFSKLLLQPLQTLPQLLLTSAIHFCKYSATNILLLLSAAITTILITNVAKVAYAFVHSSRTNILFSLFFPPILPIIQTSQ